jgi:hypothetical protein
MPLFRHNQPNHSLLLMPVRLKSERWPKNKVRILSCDTEGNLFTQLVGRSVYRRIKAEAERRELSPNNYATIYWDTGMNRHVPVFVDIGDRESWAMERILEHAFRSAIVPDVLIGPIREIIRLGESKHRELVEEKTKGARKIAPPVSSKVLDRLPFYSKNDIEVSMPLYKAEYAFPLVILKRLVQENDIDPGEQPLLILDSDGDVAAVTLPEEQINKAERKLDALRKKGKEGSLICLKKPEGISIDVMEISDAQRQALEIVAQYFEETGTARQPLSDAVSNVLDKVKEIVSN